MVAHNNFTKKYIKWTLRPTCWVVTLLQCMDKGERVETCLKTKYGIKKLIWFDRGEQLHKFINLLFS